jgi:tape measure domain-containing protein
MAGLTIKISADTQGAITQFKELAGSSDAMAAAIEKANAKFASADIQKFTDKQKLAQAALTATRGETGAMDASISAYQRKIESLVKQGLSPESEQVKTLVAEMETLRARKDAAAAASEAQAQREAELAAKFEEAAKAAEQEADTAVKSLDAKSGLEKENIRLAAEQDRVRESIKKLIASGMDPESAEVKNLEAEYRGLTREIETNTKAREIQENMVKGAIAGLAAIAAATAAAIGYSVTQAAKVEDMAAAYTTLLGSQEKAAALVKRINKEAATTPFEIAAISGSMNKLLPLFKGNSDAAVKTFRMIGDTAGGNAQKLDTLTDAYAKVQMKGKASMSELNRISNAGVPIFDVLSETLGVTVQHLFDMSKNGDITAEHLTAAFQKMTSEGGTFFNGMENSSDTFNMRLLGIKENVNIVASQIGEKFLPALKDVAGAVYDAVSEFSAWTGEGDNLENMLEGVGYALAGVTGGMAAFIAVTKRAEIVNAMAKAVGGLNKALSGNAIGIAAGVVAAVAVPAFIALEKHLDESANKVRTLNGELSKQNTAYSEAKTVLGGLDENKLIDADTTDKFIGMYPELTNKITAYKTSVEEAKTALEELNRQKQQETIDAMVAAYRKETEALASYSKGLEATEYVVANSMGVQKEAAQRTLDSQRATMKEMVKHAEDSRRAIAAAYAGIGQELVAISSGNIFTKPLQTLVAEAGKAGSGAGKTAGGNMASEMEKTLAQKLKNIKLTPEQDYAGMLADFESYLNSMADMENLSGAARVAAVTEQEALIRNSLNLTAEEKKALIEASAKARTEALEKEAAELAKAAENSRKADEAEADRQKKLHDEFIRLEASKIAAAANRYTTITETAQESYDRQIEELERAAAQERDDLLNWLDGLNEMYAEGDEKRIQGAEAVNKQIEELERNTAKVREGLEQERLDKEAAANSKTMSRWEQLEEAKMKASGDAFKFLEALADQAQMIADTFVGSAGSIFNSISQIVDGFLNRQQEALNTSRTEAEAAIKGQYEWLLAEEQYSAEELQALLDSANAKKLAGEQLTADERKAVEYKMNQEIAASEAKFAAQQADLDKKKKEEARKAAIYNRVLAIAQVPIDTARAVLKAIGDFGPPPSPLGIAGIAAAGAVGAAQMAALMATPIPSAETGGRFIVPETFTGVDSGLVRVNRGERLEVTPRGGAGGQTIQLVVNLDGRPIIDFTNENLRGGNIYEISPAWNMAVA